MIKAYKFGLSVGDDETDMNGDDEIKLMANTMLHDQDCK